MKGCGRPVDNTSLTWVMTISGCLIICPAWSQRSKKALIWHTGRTYSYSRDQMGTTDTTGCSGHSTKVIIQECRLPHQVLFTGAALANMLAVGDTIVNYIRNPTLSSGTEPTAPTIVLSLSRV